MKAQILPASPLLFGFLFAAPAQMIFSQQAPAPGSPNPIYRVTVVERTVKAVNYQYLSDPTMIDFRGTVLLPKGKGEAMVQSRRGRTEIEANFNGLTEPFRFGSEYLTYVLWAITPEGRPHNIAELIPNGSMKANVTVTTDLQAFALIVTAEPYSAVRQPSDVVVMQNEIRPDTFGTIKPVDANVELMPRGQYTWNPSTPLDPNLPKVSMHEYEALTEIQQAQNAVGVATAAHADRYAPDVLARAQQMLTTAQQLHQHKGDFRRVVENAREAAQTAEDARALAQQRFQTEQLAASNAQIQNARQDAMIAQQAEQREKDRALQEVQLARAQTEAAQAQAQAAIVAREQAEAQARAAQQQALQAQSSAAAIRTNNDEQITSAQRDAQKRQLRARLREDLNGVLPTLDTGRGLVVSVTDERFSGASVSETSASSMARIARIMAVHPELQISVEGYVDTAAKASLSRERAESVRLALMDNGLSGRAIAATGLGDSRPLGSNASAQGRKSNSRVEIVISGGAIGELPTWEHEYPLTGSAREISK